jgi:YegS/Rv2252/BmrU family lipid kinase
MFVLRCRPFPLLISVIINPIAGGARPGAAGARAALARRTLASRSETVDIVITERRGHAHELARSAAMRGARLVLAWGGDGTMNEVASALAFGPTPFGIVPSGSGNGLARELGVSRRPAEAMARAARAEPRIIDAGELGGRLFCNLAGIGFDAHVARCLATDASGRRGFPSYIRIVMRELPSYRPLAYRIDGRVTARPAMLVTLANSPQFGNGARIAPEARIDDGRLDLVVVEEVSRFQTVLGLPRLFLGGVARMSGVSMRPVERATVEAAEPMLFHVDGEPVEGGTRLEGRVLPRALRIAV